MTPLGNCPNCHGTGDEDTFSQTFKNPGESLPFTKKVYECPICYGSGDYYGPRYRCLGCSAWMLKLGLCLECEYP